MRILRRENWTTLIELMGVIIMVGFAVALVNASAPKTQTKEKAAEKSISVQIRIEPNANEEYRGHS